MCRRREFDILSSIILIISVVLGSGPNRPISGLKRDGDLFWIDHFLFLYFYHFFIEEVGKRRTNFILQNSLSKYAIFIMIEKVKKKKQMIR